MSQITPGWTVGRPWGSGASTWVRDATPDNSSKTLTVPANKVWDVKFIAVNLTATATVGNRYLALGILNDSANLIWATPPVGPITATQIGQIFATPGMPTSTAVRRSIATAALNVSANAQADTALDEPTYLPAAYVIKALDTAAIDASADDLILEVHYIEYSA